MEIRILEVKYSPKNARCKDYAGKVLTVTSGFIYPRIFDHETIEIVPLDKAQYYFCTDNRDTFYFVDVRRQFAKLIADKAIGVHDLHLGISMDPRDPNSYTSRVEIISY